MTTFDPEATYYDPVANREGQVVAVLLPSSFALFGVVEMRAGRKMWQADRADLLKLQRPPRPVLRQTRRHGDGLHRAGKAEA